MGVFVFGLVGGEPLLRKDIFEILEYARKKDLATSMSTNGTLIDKEIAKKLKEVNISEVSVSLDGLESFHDQFRGKKCFEKVISAIRNLIENGIYTIVASCVCPENFDDLEKMSKLIRELGVDSWRLFPIVPTGRADCTLLLSKEQLLFLQKFVLNKRKEIRNIFLGETAGWCGNIDQCIKLVPWDGCRAGKEYCAINVEGYLKACPVLPDDFLEASIRKNKFSELWKDKEIFKNFREFDIKKLKGKCQGCDMREVCQGGCRVVATSFQKDFYGEFPFCTYKKQ
jgi:radical SAM protein with 4Fe4S-binding SPASM domain